MARDRNPPDLHLRPDPNNVRIHDERSREAIRASLEAVGAGRSILVDGDGIVRAGNGVYEAARALGLKIKVVDTDPDTVIAVRRPDLYGELAVQAAVMDNRAAELSAWNHGDLAALLAADPDAYGAFWSEEEFSDLFATAEDERIGVVDGVLASEFAPIPPTSAVGLAPAPLRPPPQAPPSDVHAPQTQPGSVSPTLLAGAPENRYRQQYGVIVICDDEPHQARVYEQLRALGLTVRVVVT